MSPRGPAGDGQELGVPAVVGDVGPSPGDGALDVDDVLGPRRSRAQAVVDRDAHPATIGQVAHERMGLPLLLADHPRAAVDLEQHRGAGVVGQVGPLPDVEAVPRAGIAVDHVPPVGRGVPGAAGERRQQQRPARHGGGGRRGERLGDLAAVRRARAPRPGHPPAPARRPGRHGAAARARRRRRRPGPARRLPANRGRLPAGRPGGRGRPGGPRRGTASRRWGRR